MKKASETEELKHDKILLAGDSGAGKSILASMLPAPIAYFDFDGKFASVVNYWKGKDPARLEQIDYTSYNEPDRNNPSAWRKFLEGFQKMNTSIAKNEFKYKTVVIDSLTTMSRYLMYQIMKENKINRFDKWTPVLQDYGIFASWMEIHVQQFLSLPCTVVNIAHLDIHKDELTGRVIRVPYMWGRFATRLPMVHLESWNLKIEKGERVLQTKADSYYNYANTCSGVPDGTPANWESLKKHLNCGEE